jgi:hypothetical protein
VILLDQLAMPRRLPDVEREGRHVRMPPTIAAITPLTSRLTSFHARARDQRLYRDRGEAARAAT